MSSERILLCVDKGMDCFGEVGRSAVYANMQQHAGLTHSDIPARPRDFVNFLTSVFGVGSTVIEQAIVNQMRSQWKLSDNVRSFEDAVNEVYTLEK